MKHNIAIIKLFNKALVTTNKVPFETISQAAVQAGYLVHPDVCNTDVQTWLKNQDRNYNSTFYKKWGTVLSKNRFELFIDQLLHYASTYGTNFTGEAYIPEETVEVPPFKDFKVILPITKEEVISRCEKLLFSGIALAEETMCDLLNILSDFNHVVDIEKVRNKEAKMVLYAEYGKLPVNETEMVRYLVYQVTNKTLLVQNKETFAAIKASRTDISQDVEKYGYEKLASVFLRFKNLFLAFKTTKDNKKCINKLRKLAVKYHKPLAKGYFETLLSNPASIVDLPNRLKEITNFKKVSLLQSILVRKKELSTRVFLIRNQKVYIKEEVVRANKNYFNILYSVIYQDLVESLKGKACKINLPVGINLTLPASEKSFIGNYPIGTSIDFSDSDNIVGINWKGVDGANDLDLSLRDIDGTKYGWNAAYKNSNNSIVYSGDMTSAQPEATELFYASKGFKPSIVKVNLFSGSVGAKFKFFVAKEKIANMNHNYMVDPNNIIVNVDCAMDSNEKSLGVITENKFILAHFRTGKGRVSVNSVTDLYTNYALDTLDCYLSLEKLLTDAGFTFTNVQPDIDLTDLSKDSLIDLLNK